MIAEADKELLKQVHDVLKKSQVRRLVLGDCAQRDTTPEDCLYILATVATAIAWLVKKNYLRFPAEAKPSLN